MTRAILLDLGKVIIPFDFSIGYAAIERLCGLKPEAIRERIRQTGLVPRFETGLIEPANFVTQLSKALNLEIDYAAFCEIWSSIFSRDLLIPEPVIQALGARYPLVLVSNTNALHFEMIRETYPVLRHFRKWILSYEVHAMKPSEEIYRAAVEAAGVAPEECFFTDDIADYVEGARRYNIDAVQFQNADQLTGELTARGVVWR